MTICFDEICRQVECNNYIEWEHEEDLWDREKHYISEMTCVSCTEVGQSYNIEEYPDNCPHKIALDQYKKEMEAAHVLFLKKCEQEEIWKRLNDID